MGGPLARLMAVALAVNGLGVVACGGDNEGDDGADDGADGGSGVDPSTDPAWIAQRASEVRELEFRDEVEVVTMTRAEFRAQAEENAVEIDEAELQELAQTYGRLGYFPIDADLRPILASSSDWVGASYSYGTKRITVVEDSPGDAPAALKVHEFVHALQDQNFDLVAFDEAVTTSDEFMARRAVVEGDAVLAEARFVAQDEYDGDLDGWDWPVVLDNYGTWADDLLAGSPYALFVDYPGFVYSFGLGYTATNLLGTSFAAPLPHDWSLEDALFTERPPATTSQVVQRSFESSPAEPIGLDAVPPALADRLEAVDWDTLGAWYAYLLFYGRLYPGWDVSQLASAWMADRVLFVRDLERDGAIATVWVSSWATDQDAFDIEGAISGLWEVTLVTSESLFAGTASDGEQTWVEQRGHLLVAIKNLEPALAESLAAAAFDPPPRPRARRARPPLRARLRRLVH